MASNISVLSKLYPCPPAVWFLLSEIRPQPYVFFYFNYTKVFFCFFLMNAITAQWKWQLRFFWQWLVLNCPVWKVIWAGKRLSKICFCSVCCLKSKIIIFSIYCVYMWAVNYLYTQCWRTCIYNICNKQGYIALTCGFSQICHFVCLLVKFYFSWR